MANRTRRIIIAPSELTEESTRPDDERITSSENTGDSYHIDETGNTGSTGATGNTVSKKDHLSTFGKGWMGKRKKK